MVLVQADSRASCAEELAISPDPTQLFRSGKILGGHLSGVQE